VNPLCCLLHQVADNLSQFSVLFIEYTPKLLCFERGLYSLLSQQRRGSASLASLVGAWSFSFNYRYRTRQQCSPLRHCLAILTECTICRKAGNSNVTWPQGLKFYISSTKSHQIWKKFSKLQRVYNQAIDLLNPSALSNTKYLCLCLYLCLCFKSHRKMASGSTQNFKLFILSISLNCLNASAQRDFWKINPAHYEIQESEIQRIQT
jgi:hypothetical protein